MNSKLEKLKKAKNIDDLSELLGYKTKNLAYLIYKIPDEDKYKEFKINKKSGGFRIIQAPNSKIKLLQQRTSELLTSCYEEIFTFKKDYRIWGDNRTVSYSKSISHGFRKMHSIMSNASKHRNRRYVFNIDLKDFFPSINFGRVRGYFINNKYFKLNENIATILSQIICYNNQLPQGSPCSPIVSNMIGHILDIKMVSIARNEKCVYSRYVDDLTFSTNKKKFPKSIAKKNLFGKWVIGKKLKKEIISSGFKPNNKKTVMQYKSNRQIVTGLVVNKKVNVKKEYYRNARSMCNELFQKNIFYHKVNGERIIGTLNELEGILGHIYHVKKFEIKRTSPGANFNPKGIQTLYKKFLLYKHFYCNDKATIVTEGITDPVYLKSAFKRYKDEYEFLNDKESGEPNFSFFNFKNKNIDIFEIPSGTPGIKKFIENYDKFTNYFFSDGLHNPVIVFLDNDSGFKEIRSLLKGKYKIKNMESNKIYRVCFNLYVAFVVEKKDSSIENLFPENILNTKISGKSFNKNNEMDSESEYGKVVFANAVVRPNYKEIDFSLFKPAIEKLGVILNDYSAVKKSVIDLHRSKRKRKEN